MRKTLIIAVLLGLSSTQAVFAQTDLGTHADADGVLDVQKLTCAELTGTWQQDADMLAAWYSGWYNGLAHKHMLNVTRAKEAEQGVIKYCAANPEKLIIEGIAVVFDDIRAKLGIKMQP